MPGETVLLFERLQVSPLSAEYVARCTSRDPILYKVHHFVITGWPTQLKGEEECRPYFQRQFELLAHQGCLPWGNRVIVPPRVRSKVMEVLHSTHSGASRMKALARSYVWWAQMDAEIEKVVKNCVRCQECQKSPAKAPLHLWEWPERAWSRVHADYVGPI